MSHDDQRPHILSVDPSPKIIAWRRHLLRGAGFPACTLTSVERDPDAIVALAPEGKVPND